MSAETLRRAAALMRERAESVPPEGLSDWWFDAEASDLMHLRQHDREQIATFGHPAVALAVADWLESSASVIDGLNDAGSNATVPPGCFAVARAYLGESA